MVVSKAAKKGFRRATSVFVENREWPTVISGKVRDASMIKEDWYRVGSYVRIAKDKCEFSTRG